MEGRRGGGGEVLIGTAFLFGNDENIFEGQSDESWTNM